MEDAAAQTRTLTEYLHSVDWPQFIFAVAAGVVLYLVVHFLFKKLQKAERPPKQVQDIIRKTLLTLIFLFAITHALAAFGVNFFSLLGAAGVVGIAVGFASQTALSNLISGAFLLSERSLKDGDYVRVNGQEGTVESIRLLSITLKQADGALVRVPCETMIKNPVTNITGIDLRRCDFDIGVDYESDLTKVRQVILQVIKAQSQLSKEPAPSILFSNFGDSSLNLHIGAWCKTEDYHDVRYHFAAALLAAFRQEGINIPFPTRNLLLPKDRPDREGGRSASASVKRD